MTRLEQVQAGLADGTLAQNPAAMEAALRWLVDREAARRARRAGATELTGTLREQVLAVLAQPAYTLRTVAGLRAALGDPSPEALETVLEELCGHDGPVQLVQRTQAMVGLRERVQRVAQGGDVERPWWRQAFEG